MTKSNSITFSVPGKAVPCVRTTQKQKWVSKSYKRYEDYRRRIKDHVLSVMLRDRIEQINGIDMRAIDKVEIKTFVGDREFMTVLEVQP